MRFIGRNIVWRSALAAVAGVWMAGCSSLPVGDTRGIQYEVNQVKLSLSRLNESQNTAFRTLQFDIEQMNKSLKRQSMTDAQRLTEIENRLAALEERIAAIAAGNTGGAAGGENYSSNGGTTLATPEQDKLLQDAQTDYAKGEYDTAIEKFSSFIQKFPEAPGAADASYYLALCYYDKKEYNRAHRAFEHVIMTYPTSSIMPQSLHSRGLCEYRLRQYDEARATFSQLQTEYPDYEPQKIEEILNTIP